MAKAAAAGALSLSQVSNTYSRDAMLLWLRYHIAETFFFLGIYDTASKFQVQQTAELILDHEVFAHLNLDEFLLFLNKFKQGEYGKIYQSARPNPQEFLACLKPFWNELLEYRIRAAERERNAQLLKERGSYTPPTPEQQKRIDEIRQRISEKFNPKKKL